MDIALVGLALNRRGYNLYALVIDGACQVREYIDSLNPKNQKQIVSLFNLINETGIPHNIEKYRDIGDDISELKTRGGVRILCFTAGAVLPRSLVLTHGFHKPHRKILIREKRKALSWREQFFQETLNMIEIDWRENHVTR